VAAFQSHQVAELLLYSVGLSTGLIRCSRDLMAAICLLTARASTCAKTRPHTWRRLSVGSRRAQRLHRELGHEAAGPVVGRRGAKSLRPFRPPSAALVPPHPAISSNTAACTVR